MEATIKAVFKGSDSLGYKKNVSYQISLNGNKIKRLDGTGVCIYGSVQAFLNNWKPF